MKVIASLDIKGPPKVSCGQQWWPYTTTVTRCEFQKAQVALRCGTSYSCSSHASLWVCSALSLQFSSEDSRRLLLQISPLHLCFTFTASHTVFSGPHRLAPRPTDNSCILHAPKIIARCMVTRSATSWSSSYLPFLLA